jgi:hypothetical protein
LAKNAVGNDNTLKATLTDANANYGYDITTLTAQVFDVSASGLLADCSGTFDLDIAETNQASTNQLKNLVNTGTDDLYVDRPYKIDVTKSYSLNSTVYNRYLDAKKSVDLAQTGSIKMDPMSNTVYYMGNPEITAIDITVPRTVKITAQTHGTTLTDDDAFTLVLVAKDGLAGYATGANLGPMGTQVRMGSSSLSDPSFNRITNINENNKVEYTFTTTVDITSAASCIGIVDVTNGHSAISLSNFPTSALDANYNSVTN